jgi:glycosyltransferase involved in cell wall biosynthesis
VYVARFIPVKRHEILKRLAVELPDFEFISIGGLIEAEKNWFNDFSRNLPANYHIKTNLPEPELLTILHDSRIYVHLMEGEHFGIAPVEGLASGCVTLVHNSGGMTEFIPEEYRWNTYEDLKGKIVQQMESSNTWEMKRPQLWSKISVLTPKAFKDNIWRYIEDCLN